MPQIFVVVCETFENMQTQITEGCHFTCFRHLIGFCKNCQLSYSQRYRCIIRISSKTHESNWHQPKTLNFIHSLKLKNTLKVSMVLTGVDKCWGGLDIWSFGLTFNHRLCSVVVYFLLLRLHIEHAFKRECCLAVSLQCEMNTRVNPIFRGSRPCIMYTRKGW